MGRACRFSWFAFCAGAGATTIAAAHAAELARRGRVAALGAAVALAADKRRRP